ncbi:hypothetical protein DL89DRAFT_53128 [Linderina pennispora]|uniref:Uncharacterized protein n=1 Tax=Linderina pennispora TaxID=61395 RepID=A0A1Y1W0U7_9FUNG|nr:uncharacterized protein DL89DRAFT_53128 [Linderina pennispora]ORX67153.1 hypothetical protein DL89DRAFT_53128 [Linderina pennispora]
MPLRKALRASLFGMVKNNIRTLRMDGGLEIRERLLRRAGMVLVECGEMLGGEMHGGNGVGSAFETLAQYPVALLEPADELHGVRQNDGLAGRALSSARVVAERWITQSRHQRHQLCIALADLVAAALLRRNVVGAPLVLSQNNALRVFLAVSPLDAGHAIVAVTKRHCFLAGLLHGAAVGCRRCARERGCLWRHDRHHWRSRRRPTAGEHSACADNRRFVQRRARKAAAVFPWLVDLVMRRLAFHRHLRLGRSASGTAALLMWAQWGSSPNPWGMRSRSPMASTSGHGHTCQPWRVQPSPGRQASAGRGIDWCSACLTAAPSLAHTSRSGDPGSASARTTPCAVPPTSRCPATRALCCPGCSQSMVAAASGPCRPRCRGYGRQTRQASSCAQSSVFRRELLRRVRDAGWRRPWCPAFRRPLPCPCPCWSGHCVR